jgi:hypothetical protein
VASPYLDETMGKHAKKKIELARKILDTQDEDLLRSVEELAYGGPPKLNNAELKAIKEIRDRHIQGDGRSSSWPHVVKRVQAMVRERKAK